MKQSQVRRQGVQTTGTIAFRRAGPLHMELAYSYQHEGKTYHQIQPVTKEAFDKADEGVEVPILYLPNDPHQSILRDIERTFPSKRMAYFFWIITCSVGFIFVLFTIATLTQSPN